MITRIGDDGGIVIPEEYLQAMELKIGDEVILRLENGRLRIVKSTSYPKPVREEDGQEGE